MRATNRGDVPTPHVPPGQAKNETDPGEDVVFDAGSLSFVKDWVVDGGDSGAAGAAAAAVDVEPAREDPRQSNPNRRLGVGAQPKKPKQERPEPSALEKKLLRKRQRQELSDAIGGEVDTHGVVNDDKDGDVESKTASFKKKNSKRRGGPGDEQDATALDPPASSAGETRSKKSKKSNKDKQDDAEAGVKVGVDETTAGEEGGRGGGEGEHGEREGEKHGRKRKARRKKNKSATAEAVAEGAKAAAAAAETTPQTSAAIVEQHQPSVEAESEAADDGQTKKQRRGWGKARPKPIAAPTPNPPEGANQASDAAEDGWKVDERRPRKKTRSKQKNIRKDKRPLEKRPSYLRAGDPEFSGRGLTDETRKFLGLPADDVGDAPPAGWGKPGKVPAKPVFLIDKKPRKLPKHLAPEGIGYGHGAEAAEAVVRTSAAASVGKSKSKSKSKSKYKNLTLPTGASKTSSKETQRGQRGQEEGQAKSSF
eukprot:g16638.t1